jgi:hypothetical protein
VILGLILAACHSAPASISLALAASLATVSQALSQLEIAILSDDATAQGVGRALDSAAHPQRSG